VSRVAERVATDPRFSRRRLAVERSRRRKLLLRASVATTIVVGVWAAFWSPLLAVREVRVTGGKHTTSAAVAAVAGLDSSDNLLLLSTSAVAAAAETLPWVKKAEVDRKLPGTVRIKVVERRPAVVLSSGTDELTVDARGRVLTAGAAGHRLPVVTGFDVGTVEPGDVIDAPEARAALAAWDALPRSLRRNVHAIFAPTIERLTLVMSGDLLVRYGAAEHLKAKNEVLKALIARVRQQGITAAYLDVRVPTSPAISPAIPTPAPVAAPLPTPTPSPTPSPSPERKKD
jgi:cell division protein FtsQ